MIPYFERKCEPGAWGAADRCLAHEGYDLDANGLCIDGRAAQRVREREAVLSHMYMIHLYYPHGLRADLCRPAQYLCAEMQPFFDDGVTVILEPLE